MPVIVKEMSEFEKVLKNITLLDMTLAFPYWLAFKLLRLDRSIPMATIRMWTYFSFGNKPVDVACWCIVTIPF